MSQAPLNNHQGGGGGGAKLPLPEDFTGNPATYDDARKYATEFSLAYDRIDADNGKRPRYGTAGNDNYNRQQRDPNAMDVDAINFEEGTNIQFKLSPSQAICPECAPPRRKGMEADSRKEDEKEKGNLHRAFVLRRPKKNLPKKIVEKDHPVRSSFFSFRMSPAVRGDSEYVPDSQQQDSRVQGNSKSLSQQSNRFTPLVGLRDTPSLIDFDHDSISTASAASKDITSLPPSSQHVAENDPFRCMVQLIKLGKVQLADYYQDLGTIPSGSWLYSTEKNANWANYSSKDKIQKHLSRQHPSRQSCYSNPSRTTTPAAKPDSSYVPSWPVDKGIPISDRVLRSHNQQYKQHEYNPSFPSLDIPLPTARSPAAVTFRHTQTLTELEQLKNRIEQQCVERLAFLEINRLQNEELARLERLRAEQETLAAKEKLEAEEAICKQLELDEARKQEHMAESPSVEGTPDFQSDQLRTLYEQFQRKRQDHSNGEGTSNNKGKTPTFVSNFGDLNSTVNAPTLRVVKVKDDYFFAPLNTDHDDYFNWVARQSLVLLQESPRNHFSLHLFLLFIKGLIDEAGSLLPNITIEVKQGNVEAPRAAKPVTFVDLSQNESGFIDTDKLYPRTMDQPRVDDTILVDVQKDTDIVKEGAKDVEMDDNILDEHRRKRDELLNTERKWFEMPPAITNKGETLPARPSTRRNAVKPGRYGPPPFVNKNTRPTTPSSTNLANVADMINKKFPNASMSERISLTKSFAEATASGSQKQSKPKQRFPIVENSSPTRNNTPSNKSSNDRKTKDWNGWQQVKKKDFKPTNKGTNPCELHFEQFQDLLDLLTAFMVKN
ncbi:hypothetical protein M378DRAFT_18687 [Amanita muscaria Koide BX008]|uniref:Uncharacterized protein n=1 Tax=Amanita muscaria (strain Koide BX008) TaxID=946122 RepID=A0A0C2WDJ9_AMAMK|nr:hypothetical protein M378DRAFT_18687 [Amanita muscaria Koide BX008]